MDARTRIRRRPRRRPQRPARRVLQELAGDPSRAYAAPSEADLAAIYAAVAEQVRRCERGW